MTLEFYVDTYSDENFSNAFTQQQVYFLDLKGLMLILNNMLEISLLQRQKLEMTVSKSSEFFP